jgi:hypothetical protein
MRLRLFGCLCAILTILAAAFALYRPLVESNTRYFRHEDDGHHFNHTVEMAKNRDFNPHYFKKPSLHFYLRIPIVVASAAWAKRHGELQSIKEIRTRDPYGLSKYAYTSSHPTILRWSRFGSVASTLLLITLTFILAYQLSSSITVSAFAACTTTVSNEVLRNSHIIGVDILMALLCVACSVLSVWAYKRYSPAKLALCALVAGLAGSAKYNAAPIALVPLVVWYLRAHSRASVFIPLLLPLMGLVLGSPYIVASFPEFWKDMTYEVWHYGVAGHEGNVAPRGIPQAIFYGRWLLDDGVGIAPALLAFVGLVAISRQRDRVAMVFLAFPFAYAGLMIMQKANFTRNMIVLVPYVAVLGALGLRAIVSRISRQELRAVMYFALAALSLVQMTHTSMNTIAEAVQHRDSRDTLATWLTQEQLRDYEIAVAGPLQIPFHLFALPGVDSFDPEVSSAALLAQRGYDYIVTPKNIAISEQLQQVLPLETTIAGATSPQRVPENPAISIFRVPPETIRTLASEAPAKLSLTVTGSGLSPVCPNSSESYCWLSNRITTLEFSPTISPPRSFILEAMSPWAAQTMSVVTGQGKELAAIALDTPGKWSTLHLTIPSELAPSELPLRIRVTRISSPSSRGSSNDSRRLGVALRRIMPGESREKPLQESLRR